MKLLLPIVLALACIALGISLYLTKQDDTAQHENDTSAIADFSNQVTSAQSQITLRNATILTFSNSLDEAHAATLVFSNHLLEAQSTIDSGQEQITNLNRQVAAATSDNQTLGQRILGLTNQIAGLAAQLASTKASLAQTNQDLVQAHQDYALLENRFRIDVAERTVVERKFNNPPQLRAQLQKLKKNPAGIISAESIYAGLNVEVKSNGWCHVIAPN
jgi:chromosome segregation ATPase